MTPKEFLLQECGNVKELLDRTLRYEYGNDGSRDFFEECSIRLDFITKEIQNAANNEALRSNGNLLSSLSSLICRIERSSIGELSWPFVDELKKIAVAVCKSKSVTGAELDPKIHVLADGGLGAYAFHPETRRPTASKRLILTIVFPKSLKHFVLLHPILGHEVGHAIWRNSRHQNTLRMGPESKIKHSGGVFANPDTTKARLFDASAPPDLKDYLKKLRIKYGIDQANFFSVIDWKAWIEEILCDLIGLSIFGPTFVAAHADLLYALDPSGVQFGDQHPPPAWRVNLILRASKLLALQSPPPTDHALYPHFVQFWQIQNLSRKNDPWFDVVEDAPLLDALNGISALLSQNAPAAYPLPSFDMLESLRNMIATRTPPVGCSIQKDGSVQQEDVDFRHPIYAGWIASRAAGALPFSQLNKLCEHGIMQQRAVRIALGKETL
jgi:hypothetical protein